ncbi:oxidoreductase HTATIP2-like [Dendronephthya gigantea]|uniref:oxidoreductase HTATIP2-like n=1 Tax=Dendronephthya gigantea TaxID=151771 RepID=UPI00106DC256|nr:oxidoreductase HTATIP2-like [Dendronephthya gigantea]
MAESEGASANVESEQTMNLKALVIGGTGAVGKCLVGELLSSKNFSKVVVLGRRNATVPDEYNVKQAEAESEGRLVQVTVDFETLTKDTVGEHFQDGDVFFNTMGTTRKVAGSAEAFYRIDHDYPMKCVEIAKECGVKHMSLLTSTGANANSWFLYMKTKGQIEEDCKKLNFDRLSIFRPGLLDRGQDKRFVEKAVGLFWKAIQVSDVAKGMRIDAEQVVKKLKSSEAGNEEKEKLFFNADIWETIKNEA